MPARVLNGNVIRDQIYAELAGEISALAAAGIRIVEQRGLAHSVVEAGLYLSVMHGTVQAIPVRL